MLPTNKQKDLEVLRAFWLSVYKLKILDNGKTFLEKKGKY